MAIKSPLITGEREVGPCDLIHAVQISSGAVIGEMTLKDHFWLWKMKYNPAILQRGIEAYSDYVGVHKWPKFWEQPQKSGSASGGGVPWPLAIVTNLVSAGITEERAWLMPECQAIWLNASVAISNGSKVSILTSEEEAFMAEQEALEKVPEANK